MRGGLGVVPIFATLTPPLSRLRERGEGRTGAAHAPRQLLGRQLAQLRRQGGQGQLAQGTLVVARGKGHQAAPGGVQWGHPLQHPGDGARRHAGGQGRGFGGCVPDHAQHLAPAQWHAHQGAGGQRAVAGIAQQVAQGAVRGRAHRHLQQMRGGRCSGQVHGSSARLAPPCPQSIGGLWITLLKARVTSPPGRMAACPGASPFAAANKENPI